MYAGWAFAETALKINDECCAPHWEKLGYEEGELTTHNFVRHQSPDDLFAHILKLQKAVQTPAIRSELEELSRTQR